MVQGAMRHTPTGLGWLGLGLRLVEAGRGLSGAAVPAP